MSNRADGPLDALGFGGLSNTVQNIGPLRQRVRQDQQSAPSPDQSLIGSGAAADVTQTQIVVGLVLAAVAAYMLGGGQ
jgi:hypothetical protein